MVVPEPATSEVAVTVRYGVGAVDDPIGREGLAHLVEHLSYEPIVDELETASLEFNGYTSLDATLYVERTTPEQLAAVLAVEARRLRTNCPALSPSAFERQREVVRNELRERSDADAIRAALAAGVFGAGHPFARRSTPEAVGTITQAEACTFFAQHYGPNNAVIVVSGNVTLAAVRPLIEASFGDVPRAAITAPTIAAPAVHQRISIDAPVERQWIVLAWPLPADRVKRAQVRALVAMTRTLVNVRVNGLVTTLELGSGATRAIAIAIAPSKDITADGALTSAEYQLGHTNSWFGSGLYEHTANRAIYRYVAALDHGFDRDGELADEAAAGELAITTPLERLRSMSRDEAHELIGTAFDPDAATIVTLHPVTAHHTNSSLVSTFREDRPRHPEDPHEAHAPAPATPAPDALATVHRRTLANGLRIVLAPLGTMPVVDVRLVFPTGTADDPPGKRGVAELAAEALDARDDEDALRFLQIGATIDADVGFDHTDLSVHGLAGQLDTLLQGLDGTVRGGNYEHAGEVVGVLNQAVSGDRSQRIAEDAWRTAIYGSHHPYVYAGTWAHTDRLFLDDLLRFRRTHYVPTGAVLIVAGNFVPADAERWIDYYFADWKGALPARYSAPIGFQALAFAQPTDDSQITLRIAFRAPADRTTALIVVEMLDETSADVRNELAASYGVHAHLTEHRLGATVELVGRVDANRAAEACTLLRERIAKLASDEMLFVSARRRVIARLRSIDTSASGLADRFVREIDLARTLDVTATSITIEQLAPLSLEHAAILIRGPAASVQAAFAALGRTPTPLR